MKQHFKVLVLGAVSGGISVAARLARKLSKEEIAVVDPAEEHFYQPLWTLAGAGVVSKRVSAKPMAEVIPPGVSWIKAAVREIQAAEKKVVLSSEQSLTYDFLVIALGLRLAWEKIPGAQEALGTQGVCSIYEYDQVEKTSQMLHEFKGGTAIFTMPPVPIKCAGAPQKIMYLADEIFRKTGCREKTEISFATAGQAIFGIPVFAKALNEVVERKNISLWLQHRLIAVRAQEKRAVFLVPDHQGKGVEKEVKFDLLHVVPPMAAPQIISESDLAEKEGDQKGWLSVDKFTLQHKKYPNIFGIGDVTGIPNSKTGAAIRKQAPVVVANLVASMEGRSSVAHYDGYSSCPLVTQVGRVILAEFGYDGRLMPTFPLDPAKERWSMWILKRYLLPQMYWRGMLKGIV